MKKKFSKLLIKNFSKSFKFFNIDDLLSKRDFQPEIDPIWNPPKRIVLIRHAEHENKPDWKMELTEKGKMQSKEIAEELKEIIGEETIKWFISPYKRCWQTFDVLSEEFGGKEHQNTLEESRLREQDPSWKERSNFLNVFYFLKVVERREFGRFFYRFPNGESGADVYDRVSSFLETLFYREFNTKDCSENFLFVSHGFTLRMFLSRYFLWTIEEFEKVFNFLPSQYVIMKLFEKEGRTFYKIINEVEIEENGKAITLKKLKRSFLKWPEDEI